MITDKYPDTIPKTYDIHSVLFDIRRIDARNKGFVIFVVHLSFSELSMTAGTVSQTQSIPTVKLFRISKSYFWACHGTS